MFGCGLFPLSSFSWLDGSRSRMVRSHFPTTTVAPQNSCSGCLLPCVSVDELRARNPRWNAAQRSQRSSSGDSGTTEAFTLDISEQLQHAEVQR